MPPGLSMYKSRPSPCYPPLPGGGDSTPQPYKRREVKRFWKLFSRRVFTEDGLGNLVRLSGPLTPQPVGDRSPKIVSGRSEPPPHHDPRRFCGGRGKPAPRPRESRSCSWGRGAGKGLPEGWRRNAARVEEWPGRFLRFSSPPSLTLILLLPRNLRSEGQKVAFAGRTVKWDS